MDALELKRQAFHFLLGLLILWGIHTEWLTPMIMVAVISIGGVLSVIAAKRDVPVVSWLLKQFERPKYRKSFPGRGALFFWIGSLLAVKLFDSDVALVSIVILTFGDSLPPLLMAKIPKNFSKTGGSLKHMIIGTLCGTIAAFIGFLALKVAIPQIGVSTLEGSLACIISMAVGAVEIEMNQQPLDDNLLVPLAAGGVIAIIRAYF